LSSDQQTGLQLLWRWLLPFNTPHSRDYAALRRLSRLSAFIHMPASVFQHWLILLMEFCVSILIFGIGSCSFLKREDGYRQQLKLSGLIGET